MIPIHEAVNIAMAIKGYNKKRLAAEINMSSSALTDFLNGKTIKLDITKAQSIADTLGCTLDYLVGNDAMSVDVSECIEAERKEQGLSTADLAKETRIPELWILKYESGDEEISSFLFSKICEALDITVFDFLIKYELYDEYIPEFFHGDAHAYQSFKKAEYEDAIKERNTRYPEIKDIVKNGWYTVAGLPARRTYFIHLRQAIKPIYMLKYAVAVTDEKNDEASMLNEIVMVCKQLATTPALKARLKDILIQVENAPADKKFHIIYPFYISVVPECSDDDSDF